MTLDLTPPEVAFAIEVVKTAAAVVQKVQSELVDHAVTKSDASPVTIADFAAQAIVGRRLEQRFPADPLVAEEDSAMLRDSKLLCSLVARYVADAMPDATPDAVCDWIDHGGATTAHRFWTLDPIDGTKGFLRGDQYAIALALIIDGQVELGVLGCPNLVDSRIPELGGAGSLVVAVRGQGAWTQPIQGGTEWTRLKVSDVEHPGDVRLLRSVDAGHTNTGRVAQLMKVLGINAPVVLMDSQAKYAVMAAGTGDLLFRLLTKAQPDYREKIWDHAAGSLIIEEAGGQVTDLLGKPLDFTKGRSLTDNIGILASNGRVHQHALAALAAVFEDGPR